MDGTVLVADDDRTIRTVLTQALTRAGCQVHATASLVTLMRWVEEGRGDLVISDVIMPDGNGLETLPRIAARRPGLPVIVISAQNTIRTAIGAAEGAAFDYLPKPFDLPDLMRRAAQALARRPAAPPAPAAAAAPPPAAEDLPLIGRAPPMQELFRLVARMMNSDLPVLVTGESGVGKTLVARTLHELGDRRFGALVPVTAADLGAPAALLARAGGGAILFDEVADLDPGAQLAAVRLLDALPDPAPRVLATTQHDLAAAAGAGGFRPDLFYRLAGVILAVPPLRARSEDIAPLARHILARAARDGAVPRHLTEAALEVARAHPWPGNVRELEHVLRRLAATAPEAAIGADEMRDALAQPVAAPGADAALLSASVAQHLRRYFDLHGGALPPPGLYQRILAEIEAPLLDIALEATNGNQARCAALLGINRNTLRKKIADLDIRVTRRRRLM